MQVRDFAASLFLEWSGDVADGDLMFDVSLDCCFLLLRISCDAISARLYALCKVDSDEFLAKGESSSPSPAS